MEVTSCLTLKDLIGTRKPKIGTETDEGRNAQKENIFVDRSRITPKTPMKNEPMDLSKQRGYTPEKNPITPVKVADRPQSDPWTPTANLKMLISAASPDIRDREKKKDLFRPIENNNKLEDALQQFDVVDDGMVDEFEKRPSRKQKSLGLLCQKFLARYQNYPISTEKTTISLDEVVTSLGVERRRIYDIVNVLESLHLVSRVAKNQYCWHGKHNLNQTLKNLRQIGEGQKYDEQMVYFQHKELDLEYRSGDRKRDGFLDTQGRQLLEFSEADCSSASANSRKDKSLRIMSQKFVMLFLVSTTKIVTLDIAAKILIEESQDAADHSKFKTKVRRLYDIANVLTSLALIKKVHVVEERGRKPAFKWIGPVDFDALDEEKRADTPASAALLDFRQEAATQLSIAMTGKQRLTRHASFGIAPSSEGVKRKVNSEPNSPQRERKAFIVEMEKYSVKMAHLAAVCREKTEENATKTFSQEQTIQPAGNVGSVPPFSVMLPTPLESDHCLKPLQQLVPSVGQSEMVSQMSLRSGVNGQVSIMPASLSQAGTTAPPLISSQPYVCLRSAPLLMLCSSLQEGFMGGGLRTVENHSGDTEQQVLPEKLQDALPIFTRDTPNHSIQKCQSPPTFIEDDELLVLKKLKTEPTSPQPLALTKKSFEVTDGKSLQNSRCTTLLPQKPHFLESGSHSLMSAMEKDAVESVGTEEQQNVSRNGDFCESLEYKEHRVPENVTQALMPQYLYVPSAAGLNSFNVLLSANQAPGAVGVSSNQLASLNVPCVVMPSTSLAQVPVLCSPAVSVPAGSVPNTGSLNYSLPNLGPATHLLIGAAAMVTPQALEVSPAYPQQSWSPVRSNSALGRSCGSVKPDSPICSQGQPITVLKLQQSPTPQTPKNPCPAPRETFFKTPGSLCGPVTWRKSEGIHNRNTSSAQRRLEIPSGAMD
ncbi:transcription factor E2F7 isoform X1 [Rhinatrema bivittatum]|uniref:transcription factor E2F7 isoform X1 n=1 Tax=Rhinatrema bivittatum TaxID=194408 RepID=UPI0011284FCC|nr:transcription factor E2F7 isoform X1 [Rhinatrema bivittatum]XP_029452999.1 transcription factor E2F7 isoform X1 [Rhinatrema bivittatum]XP_029453000.1 transcription factor E2F7 isoform X1 [Rhinatrema bivittatum]